MTVRSSSSELSFLFLPDEAGYIDVCEGGHQVLTVEPIHDATVAGDGVGKVLKKRREQGVIPTELSYLSMTEPDYRFPSSNLIHKIFFLIIYFSVLL